METKEKSLPEHRAAIEAENAESADKQEPKEDGKSDTQVASTEETTTGSEGDTTQPPEKPAEEEKWVVPGRFRTYEDVLESYKNLESMAGRQASEIQRLRSVVTEPTRTVDPVKEKETRLKRFAEQIQDDPEEAIKRLVREELEPVKVDTKASEFKRIYNERKKDKEFAECEPIMVQLTEAYGDMIIANDMQNDPRLMDILFYAAKGIKAAETANKAVAEGIKKGEELQRKKGKARVEGSSSTKKSSKIDISKLTSAELKAKFEKGEIDPTE